MKELLNKSLLFSLFSILIVFLGAGIAYAQCGPTVGIPCNPLSGTVSTIPDGIVIVIKYLLSLIGIVTLTFIVISGIKYITSAGNEEKMKSAKESLNSSAFGLALALMAYTILEVIMGILNAWDLDKQTQYKCHSRTFSEAIALISIKCLEFSL